MQILKTSKYLLGAAFASMLYSCSDVAKPSNVDMYQAFYDHALAVYKEDSTRFSLSDSVEARYVLEHLPENANEYVKFNAQRKVDIATGKVLKESEKRLLFFQNALDSVKQQEAKKALKAAKLKK